MSALSGLWRVLNRPERQCPSTQGMRDDQPPSTPDSSPAFTSPDLCRLTIPITIQLTTKSGALESLDKKCIGCGRFEKASD